MPKFELLFTLNRRLNTITLFIIYKHMYAVFLCKSFNKIVLMLIHSSGKIISDSDIERAVTFTR